MTIFGLIEVDFVQVGGGGRIGLSGGSIIERIITRR